MKVGGARNFGFGKQLGWAGRQAFQNRYGEGHYASVEAHSRRWNKFVDYLRANHGIRDARSIDNQHIKAYCHDLRDAVACKQMSVDYAQNLVSTMNVGLHEMRGDHALRVSPSQEVGERSYVREDAPNWLHRDQVDALLDTLRAEPTQEHEEPSPEELLASQVELARDLDLRWKETILCNAQRLYAEALDSGVIAVEDGTKNGRGREIEIRNEHQLDILHTAAKLQERLVSNNFIKEEQSYRSYAEAASRLFYEEGGHHFHDLRAAYACERYEEITGFPAPCVAGELLATREADHEARSIITQELGHSPDRVDVVVAYIGGRT